MGELVWEADIEFHQAVAEASGNSVLSRILSPMADPLVNARKATALVPAAVQRALKEHAEIAAAIEAHSVDRARDAMTAHIESAIWALDQLPDSDRRTGTVGSAMSKHRFEGPTATSPSG